MWDNHGALVVLFVFAPPFKRSHCFFFFFCIKAALAVQQTCHRSGFSLDENGLKSPYYVTLYKRL